MASNYSLYSPYDIYGNGNGPKKSGGLVVVFVLCLVLGAGVLIFFMVTDSFPHGLGEATVEEVQPLRKSVDTIASEVVEGIWGNGAERRQRLEAYGYNYAEVQAAVSLKLGR
jgi:hypothetical protein